MANCGRISTKTVSDASCAASRALRVVTRTPHELFEIGNGPRSGCSRCAHVNLSRPAQELTMSARSATRESRADGGLRPTLMLNFGALHRVDADARTGASARL